MIVLRPLIRRRAQAAARVFGEARPRAYNILSDLDLDCRIRHAASARRAKDNRYLAPVPCARVRVEGQPRVLPLAEIPVPPHRHLRRLSGRPVSDGAREIFQVQDGPGLVGLRDAYLLEEHLDDAGLVVVVAQQHGDFDELARLRERVVVREDGGAVDGGVKLQAQRALGLEDLRHGFALHACYRRRQRCAGVAAAEVGGQGVPGSGVVRWCGVRERGGNAGLGNQAGDDRVRGPGVGVEVYARCAGGLAEEGYARRIAAEGGDVVAHPFYGQALVQETGILGHTGVWEAGKAEDIYAVA